MRGCHLGAILWKFARHVYLGGDLEVDPELAGGTTRPIWPGNASDQQELESMAPGRGMSGTPCLCDPTPDIQKKMDG